MSSVPDGKDTITAEGRDLRAAIQGAAQQLGLHPAQVDYKLDLAHFRSHTGAPVAQQTVKIIAWGSERPVPEGRAAEDKPRLEERAARAEAPTNGGGEGSMGSGERAARPPREDRGDRPERRERRERPERGADRGGDRPERSADRGDRGGERPERSAERAADQGDRGGDRPAERTADRGDRGGDRERRRGRRGGRDDERPAGDEARPEKPESLRGAEAGPTEASDFAQKWFSVLMELMGVVGTVEGTGSADRVHLAVKAERAGRIVGKRGATLGSIRHLLGLALEKKFGATPAGGPMTIDVDVGDDRPKEERETQSRDREERPDRGDRGDRRRGGDRGDRGGRDRDRGESEKGRYPEEKLRALARRAAEKAAETGQTITINLELNSFDRRIVHLEVAEIDGVESQSEERAGADGRMVKFVQISPLKA